MSVEMLTVEEAIAAAERCAFEVTETERRKDGPDVEVARRVAHCFSGGIGCDWDVESVIATIKNAYVHDGEPQIAFSDSLFGRCLHVIERIDDTETGGKLRLFDTITPDRKR